MVASLQISTQLIKPNYLDTLKGCVTVATWCHSLVSVTLLHLVTFRIQQDDVGTTSLNIFSDVYIASDFFVNLGVKKRKEKQQALT